MGNKRDFSDLKVEADTTLLYRKTTEINEISCAFEMWNWDGIYGQSLIFHSDDVNHISDNDLKEMAAPLKKKADSDITIKRKEKYTYVNFNFEWDD